MEAIRIERREGGVALAVLDVPGKRVNTLTPALMREFEDRVLPLLSEEGTAALVLASGKEGTFLAGADLDVLAEVDHPGEAAELSREGNRILSALAASPKPVVAAIWGAALGGDLEVALACSYIVAAEHPDTVLGLPEVQLGLLPGAGGTQRLYRRIGLPRALPLLLTGKRVRAREALRIGLVDALTAPGDLAGTARRAARDLADGKLRRRDRRSLGHRLLQAPGLRTAVLARARRQVLAKTRGLHPAPLRILDCLAAGLQGGLEAGLARESELFGELAVSPQAKNLIWLFGAMNELKRPPDPGAGVREVHRLAILGAGFMGAGMASVSLGLGTVVLRDVADEALAAAARTIQDGLEKQLRSGAISPQEREERWSRLLLTTDLEAVGDADLVIEAIPEDLELKRRVLAEVEARIRPEAVFASNTSALPITEIAAGAQHPERILGMHYFSPVPKMPLLEIIATGEAAPWALATARAFGAAQGKSSIVVRDGPGFYTSRILAPYLNEAMLLLEEGARIEDLDRAMRDWGFPVGPATLLDEVGIDVAAHVSRDLAGRLGPARGRTSDALARLREAGYQGRKKRRGFYRYTAAGKKARGGPDPGIYRFFGGPARRKLSAVEIQERMVLAMVNEALRCLGEGIVSQPRDGDVGAILGLGFPPFTGGPFRWTDAQGSRPLADRLRRLGKEHGERFTPAPLLLDLARQGASLYGGGGDRMHRSQAGIPAPTS